MDIKKYNLILCILIFNTGCSKQVSFSLNRSSRLPPAPSTINSRDLSLLNQSESKKVHSPLAISSQPFHHTSHIANMQTPSTPFYFQKAPTPIFLKLNTNLNLPQKFNLSNLSNPDTSNFVDVQQTPTYLISSPQSVDFQNKPVANMQIGISTDWDLLQTPNPFHFYGLGNSKSQLQPVDFQNRSLANRPSNTNLNSPQYNSVDLNNNYALQFVDQKTPFIQPSLQPLDFQDQKIPQLANTLPLPYSKNINVSLSNVQPEPQESPKSSASQMSQREFRTFFPYTWSTTSFSQSVNDRNKTTLFFHAYNEKGFYARDLQKEDLIVTENQSEIFNYTLSPQRQYERNLEVVFVVDTGGNMQRYKDIIAKSVQSLKNELEEQEIHPEFCLVTFKDSVEQTCHKFIDNNFMVFQNYISNLRLVGGGGTNTQNPLAGLLAAANIPRSDNQRIIVLITDALPWLEIHSLSRLMVPRYSRVLNRLSSQTFYQPGMQVFALTRSHHLFSDLTEDTFGQWFDIRKIEKKEISIDQVFNQIGEHLNILHKIEYLVEDQQGLNPSLALEERDIKIDSQIEDIQIEIQEIQSNMPDGGIEPQSRFLLSKDNIINKDHIYVVSTVDGFKGLEYDFFIEDGEIVFTEVLPEGVQIAVQYEKGDLIDNIQRHPLILKGNHTDTADQIEISSISLKLNGKPASNEDFEIESISDNRFYFHLSENVFHNTDPYNIRMSSGLNISIIYEVTTQQTH